jgi:hypothetical protein
VSGANMIFPQHPHPWMRQNMTRIGEPPAILQAIKLREHANCGFFSFICQLLYSGFDFLEITGCHRRNLQKENEIVKAAGSILFHELQVGFHIFKPGF